MEFKAKERERNSLRNSIAPVSSLPNEVLTKIFISGCDSLPHTRVGFEMTVSQVTHHWREIALGSSTLWARIHRCKRQRTLEPIAEYLKRSRQIPIHLLNEIGFDDRDSWGEMEEEDISPFCRLIEPHASHCCRFTIESVTRPEVSKMLQHLSSMPMPMLWSLYLNMGTTHPHGEPLYILQCGAPSLTHVYLDGANLIDIQPIFLSTG